MNKLDVLNLISPQMKAVLEVEDSLAGDANDTSVGFEQMRANYIEGRKFWVAGGPEMVAKLDSEIDGPNGAIPVRFYYPTEESYKGAYRRYDEDPDHCFTYTVAAGFWATLKRTIAFVVYLPKKSEAIVVAVDYRLSPEAVPFGSP